MRSAVPSPASVGDVALAPTWHVTVLVLVLTLRAVGDWVMSPEHGASDQVAADPWFAYSSLALGSLGFALFASGLGTRQLLVGRLWSRARSLPIDFGLAALLVAAVLGIEGFFPGASSAREILPRTATQLVAWLLISLIVGFSEELVYRAYLQAQLGRLRSCPWLGLLAQALLFGLAHVTHGYFQAARIGAYGLLFGIVAHYRGNITACIVAHVVLDSTAALVG